MSVWVERNDSKAFRAREVREGMSEEVIAVRVVSGALVMGEMVVRVGAVVSVEGDMAQMERTRDGREE